ncbi:MAG: alpha-L-fucosidase [Pirellulales bacterium]|nr:alpha-L-fucosidase [Pirellulales bacterium]
MEINKSGCCVLVSLLIGLAASALRGDEPASKTPGDAPKTIAAATAGVATEPTPAIRAWEDLKFGMFVHFGLSTFVGDQFGRTPAKSTDYAPTALDVDQWARTARDTGMKYMVLTVKHHYGHALWPSKHSDFTVATSGNKTDVVEKFVEACRKHGLKPGFYYSLGWDSHHMPKRTPEQYERFVLDQMTELLTQYGPITVLWCDIPWDMGPDTPGALGRLYAHCKSLQPDCLILHNQGFVDGSQVHKREPTYFGKSVSKPPVPIWPKDVNNGELIYPPAEGHNPRIAFEGRQYYIPNEVCTMMGQRRWFWGAEDDVRPARQLVEIHRRSVGRKANLLLNAWPDRSGRIPPETVQRLMDLARLIEHPELVEDSLVVDRPVTASNVYHNDADKWGPNRAVDMDVTVETGTRWATDDDVKTAWLEVDLGGPKTFARATASEYLDAVRAFELQVPDGQGGWRTIHRGQTIGGPGIDVSFPPVTADRVRLSIIDSTGGPTLWDFAVYPTGKR